MSRIRQTDVDDAGREYVHCEAGDLGTVIGTFRGAAGPTVRFDRHGTVCDMHVSELRVVGLPRPQAPKQPGEVVSTSPPTPRLR